MADRAWDVPAAGGSILDQWPDIAAAVSPNLPAHVAAVAFHAETSQLDLRPDSVGVRHPAPADQHQGRRRGERHGRHPGGRTIRVLAAGAAGPAHREAAAAPTPAAAPGAPLKTGEEASPGYRRALAAHQAIVPVRRMDPPIAEAVERQTRAMRELSRRAFPGTDVVTDDAPAPIGQARTRRCRQADVSHAAALRRARQERAARAAGRGTPAVRQPA